MAAQRGFKFHSRALYGSDSNKRCLTEPEPARSGPQPRFDIRGSGEGWTSGGTCQGFCRKHNSPHRQHPFSIGTFHGDARPRNGPRDPAPGFWCNSGGRYTARITIRSRHGPHFPQSRGWFPDTRNSCPAIERFAAKPSARLSGTRNVRRGTASPRKDRSGRPSPCGSTNGRLVSYGRSSGLGFCFSDTVAAGPQGRRIWHSNAPSSPGTTPAEIAGLYLQKHFTRQACKHFATNCGAAPWTGPTHRWT